MDIVFIEKEPVWDNRIFVGKCWLIPVFMLKDGKEYIVFNKRDNDPEYRRQEAEKKLAQLAQNEGRYYKHHGFYEDPLRMLGEIIARKHTFNDVCNTFTCTFEEDGYIDFRGNRVEVSAAFGYRIYDASLFDRIKDIVNLIKKHKYCEAAKLLQKGSNK